MTSTANCDVSNDYALGDGHSADIIDVDVYYSFDRPSFWFSLKSEQLKDVLAFALGRYDFVSLPTGYGKTLVYAMLPALFNVLRSTKHSIVIVVSPLTALMAEQKRRFVPMGIARGFLAAFSSLQLVFHCLQVTLLARLFCRTSRLAPIVP